MIVGLTSYVVFFEPSQPASPVQLVVTQSNVSQQNGRITSSVTVQNIVSQDLRVTGRLDSFLLPTYTFTPSTLVPGGTAVGLAHASWNVSQFDGSSAYIDVPNSPSLNPSSLTLELGLKFGNQRLDPEMILGKGSLGEDGFYIYNSRIANETTDFVVYENNTRFDQDLGPIFASGRWYDVMFTLNGTMVSAFVNGEPVNAWPHTVVFKGDSRDLLIGRCLCGGYNFNGTIAFVRMYNRALSAEEAYGNFDPNTVSRSGLLLWLSSNQTQGTLLRDLSGQGHDGQILGGVSIVPLVLDCGLYELTLTAIDNNGKEYTISRDLRLAC